MLLGFFMSISCHASIDLKAGQEKAEMVCAACHGKDGNSINPLWPNLAGQHPKYLVMQMQAFKLAKQRKDASMMGMMMPLSEQDMQNVAAYFAKQPRKIGQADPKTLKRGQQLYRGGDSGKQISACIACHGPKGTGNEQAGFPALSGQHAAYIVAQLQEYKAGKRTTDLNHIMRDIASRMDKADMEAVANYISGLH